MASTPFGDAFERFVLLAFYLGPVTPVARKLEWAARWADPDVQRIVALNALRWLGLSCCESLPVIAFAVPPGSEKDQIGRYSFRLFTNFRLPHFQQLRRAR